jgi:hypothetical protein
MNHGEMMLIPSIGNKSVSPFDDFGNYRHCVVVQYTLMSSNGIDLDDIIDQCVHYAHQSCDEEDKVVFYDAHEHEIDGNNIDDIHVPTVILKFTTKQEPDYASLCPLFGWLSSDIIKKTLQNTTQYAQIPTGTLLKRTFKSTNPTLNVARCNEEVACDIAYSDTPAVNDGPVATVLLVLTLRLPKFMVSKQINSL